MIVARIRYIAKVLPAITAGTIVGSLELSRSNNLGCNLSKKGLIRTIWISEILKIAWQVVGLSAYQD